MKKLAILDPSVSTLNVGDDIIHHAVRTQLERIFPGAFYFRISTHEYMLGEDTQRIIREADQIFVGGSNLLKSKMEWRTQWKLSPLDLFRLRNAILVGCGWRHYSKSPTPYTSLLYRTVLSSKSYHSCRDQMSRDLMTAAGVPNVLNTACVTMWDLDEAHCATIPQTKAEDAIITVTGYNPDPNDQIFIKTVLEKYRDVYLFVQSPDDLNYAQHLANGRLKVISPTLDGYDTILQRPLDYIGTRLHGGIRAIQKGKRSIIISIDNRATEISADTGLTTIKRADMHNLGAMIRSDFATKITLPKEAIATWRSQFNTEAAAAKAA